MTPNEIIGSLIYRTAQALNGNSGFMSAIGKYKYYTTITHNDVFHLWHYPCTGQEVSHVFQYLGKDSMTGAKMKFPSVINYQGVIQEHASGYTTMRFNLAIVAPVLSEWTTQQREEQAYKLVLKPVEDEFIRQITKAAYIQSPVGKFPYTSVYVPTTGQALNSMMKIMYGDFLDAVELPAFTVKVLPVCKKYEDVIIEENKKVTDEIKN
jgi:hypothetical protein